MLLQVWKHMPVSTLETKDHELITNLDFTRPYLTQGRNFKHVVFLFFGTPFHKARVSTAVRVQIIILNDNKELEN